MSPTISFSQDSIDAAILRSHVFTMSLHIYISIFFFFNDTATTEIYTLSLHDALPIYEFVELGLADLGEAHQHRRVAVEMRGGEVHAGIVGDEREFHALIGHPGTEDVPVGRVSAERRVVRLAQRSFPGDQLLAHPPGAW